VWRFFATLAATAVLAITAAVGGAAIMASRDEPTPCQLHHGDLVTLQALENGCERNGQPVVLLFYDCTDGSTLAATGAMGSRSGAAVVLVPDEGVWTEGDWTSLWSTCTSP